MPFCPNCGCEYRPGYDTCPDCEAGLVEQDPNLPKAAVPVAALSCKTLEAALIALVAPWAAFLSFALAARLIYPFDRTALGTIVLAISAVAPVVLAVAWGRWRCKGLEFATLAAGWAVGVLLQVLLVAVLLAAGTAREPYKLFFCVPAAAIYSTIVLAFGWAGQFLLRRNPPG